MTSCTRNPAALAGADGADVEAVGKAIDTLDDSAPRLSPQAKWNCSNPKAMWAHAALRSALRKGLIERGPCEVCGAVHGEDDAVIHGHHEDYEKPLAVRWLCRLHHRQLHAADRDREVA
ncbi:hypothetical protein [Consotaella salsifontis]|uniref:Uncharacterized protein n=1 Tax=Consotaella salsifontis TaxID=1365950 RepID=A0A1T4SJN0_9HYPH|nr:hypothetical protein [Consotaella salsifontis]SKA28386.1 hypothetical protein SAMN05428963_11175 [Consotaella salsifontis]